MSEPESTAANTKKGSARPTHLLLDRPYDVSFDFERQRMGGAFGASVASHVAMVVLVLLAIRFMPEPQVAEHIPQSLFVRKSTQRALAATPQAQARPAGHTHLPA